MPDALSRPGMVMHIMLCRFGIGKQIHKTGVVTIRALLTR